MTKFVPKQKMSKKAQKELNSKQRAAWALSPVTRKIESKKVYNRKKFLDRYEDHGGNFSCCVIA